MAAEWIRLGGGRCAGGLGPAPGPAWPRPLTSLGLAAQPPRAGLLSGGGGCAGSRLQAEMLQMDLIDAAGDTPGAEDDEEEDEEERAARRPGAGPPEAEPRQESAPRSQGQGQGQGGGDTYRPKRPTTLNLFPQVPRSQVRRQRCGAGLKGRRPGLAGDVRVRGGAVGELAGLEWEVSGLVRPPRLPKGEVVCCEEEGPLRRRIEGPRGTESGRI